MKNSKSPQKVLSNFNDIPVLVTLTEQFPDLEICDIVCAIILFENCVIIYVILPTCLYFVGR